MAIIFDTLAFAKKLTEGGIPKKQAETHAAALADLVDEQIATKKDIKELEVALKRDIKELELKMKEMELRLTLRFGGMIAVAVAIIIAFIKYSN